MSSLSSSTRENGNTIPCEGGRNWETGKPDRSRKYRAEMRKQLDRWCQILGPSGKGSGLGVRRTALLLISSAKSLYLSESDERIEPRGLERIFHLQYLELSGQWERQATRGGTSNQGVHGPRTFMCWSSEDFPSF